MILSRHGIKRGFETREIIIEPFDEKYLGPNSYDVHLANELLVYDGDVLDFKSDNPFHRITIPEDGLILEPGTLYLGKTVEYTETHHEYAPMLEGRSSVGRLGVSIHVTAGFGDVGFCGNWTLELWCVQRIKIYPGVKIGQLYYHKLSDFVDQQEAYNGRYQLSNDVVSSRYWKNREQE